jgi:hypothetical protein
VSKKSLNERLQNIVEDDGACSTCSGGGGAEIQGADFSGGGEDPGPNAGYDKLVKGLNMIRRKKKPKKVAEAARPLPDLKMMLKASQLESGGSSEKDKDKAHKLFDRARKIRSQIK